MKGERGDLIDEKLAMLVNGLDLDVTVYRHKQGTYQIGEKKLMLTVKNHGLLIRVGGGY